MNKLSIRTLLLVTFGCAILISLFTYGATSANTFHTLLVTSFAVPGASWGYDVRPDSRGAVLGCCASAILGTAFLSAFVLLGGFR